MVDFPYGNIPFAIWSYFFRAWNYIWPVSYTHLDTRIPIDVRIISASNQELLPLTSGGSFRSDLFYRLSTLPIELPPLRKRRSDIPILIEEFKNILNASFVLTEETKNILYKYDWPGNIRELHNCVEYFGCLNLPVIEPDNLPFYIQRFAKQNQALGDATDDIISKILDILHSKPDVYKRQVL